MVRRWHSEDRRGDGNARMCYGTQRQGLEQRWFAAAVIGGDELGKGVAQQGQAERGQSIDRHCCDKQRHSVVGHGKGIAHRGGAEKGEGRVAQS